MSQARRPYRSTLREEQARATRRAVVGAARDLFVELGWSRTTIDAVAARAEVSRKTVFTSVGGKAALLKLALDWALVGDDEPVPMSERPVIAEMEQMTDPRQLVARWAQFVAESRSGRHHWPPYSSSPRTPTRKPPVCTPSPNATGSGARRPSWPVSRQSMACDPD